MKKNHRLRPSPATVIATIALFVALGGTGWAALSKNTVGTNQLKKNSVTTKKIKKRAVTAAKIANKAIGTAQLGKNVVKGENVDLASLGQVPNATNAQNFAKFVPFGLISAGNGESRTLVTYGPFSLIGRCAIKEESLDASVIFVTTEEHTAFGGDDTSSGDVGPATPESERIIEDPGASSKVAPDNSDGYDDQFNAQAPSGRSWAGTVESYASKAANLCRWSGYILQTS